MAGNYHHNPPQYPQYPQYYNINPGQPVVPPIGYAPAFQQLQTIPPEHFNPAYVSFEDGGQPVLPAQGSGRVRRRTGASGEHIKHRRTRSGCYTCRNRRVKCDEVHPICERCRKGNRECVYPQPSTSSKSRSKGKSKAAQQDSGSSEEEQEQSASDAPLSNPETEATAANEPLDASRRPSVATSSHSYREVSDTPPYEHDDGRSPSTETSNPIYGSQPQPGPVSGFTQPGLDIGRSQLPPDIQFYLDFHRNYISHRHYHWEEDPTGFLSSTFLEIASRYEPLLYAVVGFAAYHYTLTHQDRRMQEFLSYHHKAVSLLRLSLQENPKHTVALLLTVLQLATTEEYLGDQINLQGHQKAAYGILTELYTPQTIKQDPTSQAILRWYVHFSGSVSGGTMLSKEWFDAVPMSPQQVR